MVFLMGSRLVLYDLLGCQKICMLGKVLSSLANFFFYAGHNRNSYVGGKVPDCFVLKIMGKAMGKGHTETLQLNIWLINSYFLF